MSAEVLEIIRGISTVLANTYDGALDENGEPITVGLRREEGDPILDRRIMDGFNGSISGDKLIIKYQSEIHLKEVHGGKFEDEIAQKLQDISAYIKKEYKKVTGNSLTLTKEDKEPDIFVQSISKIRSWVQAQCAYKIGGMPQAEKLGSTVEERLSDTFKKFLGFDESVFPGAAKPKNVKGKRDEESKK
jgi:hypothetical protein|tara:strand:- start:473 stop:1039 length:567 start_codon:yes stop_codon:yes gene_type:complete